MTNKTVRLTDRQAGAKQTTGRPCPTCGQPAVTAHRPFCSQRCAQVDLFRWLGGNYRIPTAERPPADGEDDWR